MIMEMMGTVEMEDKMMETVGVTLLIIKEYISMMIQDRNFKTQRQVHTLNIEICVRDFTN